MSGFISAGAIRSNLYQAHWIIILCALAVMYGPTFFDLMVTGPWSTVEQAHGPIVLLIALWLVYRKLPAFLTPKDEQPALIWGWSFILLALVSYMIGRSQSIASAETASFIFMVLGLILVFKGPASLRSLWFPLFFMCFMVPLPGPFVDAVTMPMKMAVSYVAEMVLFHAGYPIARNGVILQIGQYQLLVADACAGLHTLFTLEALGLLYLNIIRHESVMRNMTLAILIVPIAFTANVIRVIVLTLITYYFGDDAGQGFLHGFAGLLLFISALLLIIAADTLLRVALSRRARNTIFASKLEPEIDR